MRTVYDQGGNLSRSTVVFRTAFDRKAHSFVFSYTEQIQDGLAATWGGAWTADGITLVRDTDRESPRVTSLVAGLTALAGISHGISNLVPPLLTGAFDPFRETFEASEAALDGHPYVLLENRCNDQERRLWIDRKTYAIHRVVSKMSVWTQPIPEPGEAMGTGRTPVFAFIEETAEYNPTFDKGIIRSGPL